jgi:glycosyltransferase involved in cell wall biosynthesis
VSRRAAALVHHPTSLEAGFDPAAHASLRATEQTMLKRLDRVVVTSDAVAQPLAASFGIDRARIAVVPPGVDPAQRSHGSGGPGCRILTLGALTPRKGHDVLLRALACLFDLNWHLTIVGTPERHPAHAAALRAMVEEAGIAGQVTFAGVIEDQALEEIWDRTDLFALATHWEATPWATMQAFRRGVPAVVSNGGAAATCVTRQNGLVVVPGDTSLLSKALRRVIFDSALRAALAEEAWNTGSTLPDWQAQAEHLANLFTAPA